MADRALFPGKVKDSKYRVQGLLTPGGSAAFERQRARIARITDRTLGHVSDADVIEWLAHGELFSLRLVGRRRQ